MNPGDLVRWTGVGVGVGDLVLILEKQERGKPPIEFVSIMRSGRIEWLSARWLELNSEELDEAR